MDNKSSLGIWIYGFIILISGLALLILALLFGFNASGGGGAGEYGILFIAAIMFMLPALILILIGTLILLRKSRLVILIFLGLLNLICIFLYFVSSMTSLIIVINLFLTSAFYFLTRPKVKEQFRE